MNIDIQKLKALTDKLNTTDKEISDIVENSAVLINSKKEKIELEDQIEKIIIKRNNAITKLYRDEKKLWLIAKVNLQKPIYMVIIILVISTLK